MSDHHTTSGKKLRSRRLSASAAGAVFLGACLLLTAGASGSAEPPSAGAPGARGGAGSSAEGSPTKKTAPKKQERPSVTFTGFHVFDDGSSRIWVRLTRAVDVEEKLSKGSVTYVLRGAKVPGRNNKYALLTSEFTSSVMSARLVAAKHDTKLVIKLKQEVTPKHRVVQRPDGTASVQIDFPAVPAVTK